MPLTTTTATATAAITTTATSSSESSDPDMSPRFSSKFITSVAVKMDQVEDMMESLAIDESSFDDSDDYVEYQYEFDACRLFDFTINETNNAVQRAERWFSIAAENHLSTLYDRSDENMFVMIGDSIKAHKISPNKSVFACTVGLKSNRAEYYLDDAAEVINLLENLGDISGSEDSDEEVAVVVIAAVAVAVIVAWR
ncbi:probable alpha,alpha-trehalose-phosphate synthase [UDP-forming] 7 [Tanacetum coccineum]